MRKQAKDGLFPTIFLGERSELREKYGLESLAIGYPAACCCWKFSGAVLLMKHYVLLGPELSRDYFSKSTKSLWRVAA
jgi:hypothetical protein